MRKQRLILVMLFTAAALVVLALGPLRSHEPALRFGGDWRVLKAIFRGTEKQMRLNGPVEFHARALDQDGQPIPDASMDVVVGCYDRWRLPGALTRGSSLSRDEPLTLKSDASGWFHLRGKTGHRLDVKSVGKPGFFWKSDIYIHYDYTPKYMPSNAPYADAKQGTTFRLWRKGPTEPLVPVGYTVSLAGARSNAFVNLFTGVVPNATTADLQFTKDSLSEGNPERQWDRRYEVRGLRGATLLWTNVPYAFAAPESGYQSAFREDHLVSDQSNPPPGDWKRAVFIRGREGRVIAGLNVTFVSRSSRFDITGYVNPDGSRVLEPDPAKLITDPDKIRRLDRATQAK